jgi:Tol biopolymer transport system component
MKADGSGQKRLSKNPGEELLPSWSPDGERIAFAGNSEPGAAFGLWTMRADGMELRSLGFADLVGRPGWSPDGTAITFSSGGDVYVWRLDSSTPRRLTDDHLRGTGSFDGSIDPAWSPDGQQIAFASGAATDHDLFVMNVDGTGRRQLTSGPANDRVPSWSPDGRTIAFSTTRWQ